MDAKPLMTIELICQAPPAGLAGLQAAAGAGPVLSSPHPDAVALAQKAYPERRIEVHERFREPSLAGCGNPGTFRRLAWMLRPSQGDESAESVRRRVIDSSVRLVELAKLHQSSTLVAGPWMLGLVAFKLNGIGYRGAFLRGFKAGERRSYVYGV